MVPLDDIAANGAVFDVQLPEISNATALFAYLIPIDGAFLYCRGAASDTCQALQWADRLDPLVIPPPPLALIPDPGARLALTVLLRRVRISRLAMPPPCRASFSITLTLSSTRALPWVLTMAPPVLPVGKPGLKRNPVPCWSVTLTMFTAIGASPGARGRDPRKKMPEPPVMFVMLPCASRSTTALLLIIVGSAFLPFRDKSLTNREARSQR